VLRHGGVTLAQLREFDDRTVTSVSGSTAAESDDESDDESGDESGDDQYVVTPDEADDTSYERPESSDEPPADTREGRPEGTG
jgi:hypothetical protein